MSEVELKRQLFEAKEEAKRWRTKCKEVTQEKSMQLKHIETNLMLLEARLQQERKEIQKNLIQQRQRLKEQENKIEKLNSTNQKLLAAMMVMRNKNPAMFSLNRPTPKSSKRSLSTSSMRNQQVKEPKDKTRESLTHISGSDLIACRAKAYAEQQLVERSVSERSPRESSHSNKEKKSKAHRSKSLPQGHRAIML